MYFVLFCFNWGTFYNKQYVIAYWADKEDGEYKKVCKKIVYMHTEKHALRIIFFQK